MFISLSSKEILKPSITTQLKILDNSIPKKGDEVAITHKNIWYNAVITELIPDTQQSDKYYITLEIELD